MDQGEYQEELRRGETDFSVLKDGDMVDVLLDRGHVLNKAPKRTVARVAIAKPGDPPVITVGDEVYVGGRHWHSYRIPAGAKEADKG